MILADRFNCLIPGEVVLASDYDALVKRFHNSEARERELEAALIDYRDHGLRFDLNPTHDLRYAQTEEGRAAAMFWHAYIKDMDECVRRRARNALNFPNPTKELSK